MRLSTDQTRYIIQWFALVFGLLLTSFAHAGALERLFAPKAELWEQWAQHTPESNEQIDHNAWDQFLQSYVQHGIDGINRLAYGNIDSVDVQLLSSYISSMQDIAISRYPRTQQLAYWINLYNALTINIVLEHYPVTGIREINISPGFFSAGPWGKKMARIEGETLSLNDIEHRILRPIWKDPRIHYALNCASLGCPNLRRRAFTASNVEEELDMAAREYVNHSRGVRFEGKDLYVSSIYSWFQRDFGQDETQVIEHLRSFANPLLSQQLQGIDSIAGDHYDWSLNDIPTIEKSNKDGEE